MIERVQLREKKLRSREADLRQLMKPLYNHHTGPPSHWIYRKNQFFVGLTDRAYRSKTDHREWRFKTDNPKYHALYFERWLISSQENNIWFLERAYLHLYKIKQDTRNETYEYLALHCDPAEPEKSKHFEYKVGPHLHIECAEYPLPKAHFGLNIGELDNVLRSVDELTNAISYAVSMIKDQVLELDK